MLLVEQMRSATEGLPLPEMVEHVVEASGLVAHYKTERESADRLENLSELVNAAAAFVSERGAGVVPAGEGLDPEVQDSAAAESELVAFLNHAALEAGERQAGAGTDAVQLMTVHSAKGLEFHAVFISGLEEGLFPHENSLTEADGLEEERRLMYVALTRARRRLYLSFAQSRMLHGQTRYNIASRFLQEIPPELMKRVGALAVKEPYAPTYASRFASASVQAAPFQLREVAGGDWLAHWPERPPPEVRTRCHRRRGRPRLGSARAGELPQCRSEMARARIRETDTRAVRL